MFLRCFCICAWASISMEFTLSVCKLCGAFMFLFIHIFNVNMSILWVCHFWSCSKKQSSKLTPQLLWSVFSLAAVFRVGLCFVFGAHAVLTVFRETLGTFCHQAYVLLTLICNVVLINIIAALLLEEIQKKNILCNSPTTSKSNSRSGTRNCCWPTVRNGSSKGGLSESVFLTITWLRPWQLYWTDACAKDIQ